MSQLGSVCDGGAGAGLELEPRTEASESQLRRALGVQPRRQERGEQAGTGQGPVPEKYQVCHDSVSAVCGTGVSGAASVGRRLGAVANAEAGAVLRELSERALRDLVCPTLTHSCCPQDAGMAASLPSLVMLLLLVLRDPNPGENGPLGAQTSRADACSRAGSAPSSLACSRAVLLFCAGPRTPALRTHLCMCSAQPPVVGNGQPQVGQSYGSG